MQPAALNNMETILKEILNRIQTQVTDLKYVGVDDGQLDIADEEQNYPILLPAALIDIAAIEWTTTLDPVQTGEAQLVVAYAWKSPNRFDSNISATRLTETLNRWKIQTTIAKALHGFSGTGFGQLERIRTEKVKRDGLLKEIRIYFVFEADEDLS